MHGGVIAALVVASSPCWAQQPFLVDDAAVTAPRVWHLEVSNQAELLRRTARPVLWQDVLDVEVVYGLADRLEVAALVPAVGLFTSSHPTVGIGDSSFGAKYRVTRTADAPHQVALSGSLELPTGSARRQLGSGLVDYGLTLVTQHRVSEAGTVRTNVGAVLVGNTQTGLVGVKTRGGVLVTGISYVRSLSSRVQAGGELVTFVSARNVGSSIINWQLGGNVALGRATTLDLGVLGGWLAASPRIGVQVGLSIDLNRAAAP